MLELDSAGIAKMKANLDKTAVAYIGMIEAQNERLHDHHSDCKAELGELAIRANKWKIRAHVAEGLAQYFNSLYMPGSSFMYPEDLKKEIDMQTERLLQMVRDGKRIDDDPIIERALKSREPVAA